jgi:hypothetical protein
VVARAIDFEMKKHGLDCVQLDISHQPPEFVKEHFPNIYARCLELGIDITRQPIPVVPAAPLHLRRHPHRPRGRTDVPAARHRRDAYTGLHGANRLASNSLVECMVFARSAATDILATPLPAAAGAGLGRQPRDRRRRGGGDLAQLGRAAPLHVGLRRHRPHQQAPGPRRAPHQLLQQEIQEFYGAFHVTRDLLELRNLVTVADLIVRSAQSRHESRGLHFSRDYPQLAPVALPHDAESRRLIPPVRRVRALAITRHPCRTAASSWLPACCRCSRRRPAPWSSTGWTTCWSCPARSPATSWWSCANALARGPLRLVLLHESPGGDLWNGYHVGHRIRAEGLPTSVSGRCESACGLIFLGGAERTFSDGRPIAVTMVGLHGRTPRTRSSRCRSCPRAWPT